MTIHVAAVVAAWDRTEADRSFTGLCPQIRGAFGAPCERVVVFNGPPKDSGAPRIIERSATLSENVGVARAWNIGWQLTTAEVVCFINEDVRLEPGSLRPILEVFAAVPEAAVVGPRGSNWDRRLVKHTSWVDREPGDPAEPCDVVSGYLFAVRRDVLNAVGGFDERFSPCGGEEVDLCFAAQELGGVPMVVGCKGVRHEWGISAESPRRRVEWMGRNEALFDITERNRRLLRMKWQATATARGVRPLVYAQPRGALDNLRGRAAVRFRWAISAAAFRVRKLLSRRTA